MKKYIDLGRRFLHRPKYTVDELFGSAATGKQLAWPQVLEARFAVIVGSANFGKTTEMRAQVERLRNEGSAALFVALHRGLAAEPFEDSLDENERLALQAWRAVPDCPMTVFVDSLDEAAAGNRTDILVGMRKVARALSWPNPFVRWVVSTRPAMLTEETCSQLNLLWGPPLTSREPTEAGGEFALSGNSTAGATKSAPVEPESLNVFSLLELSTRESAKYLLERHSISEPSELLKATRTHGLSGLCGSPGALDILVAIDPARRPPECLTDAFDRVVEAMQKLHRTDPREASPDAPQPPAVTAAIRKLASASVVCQLPNIEIPQDRLLETEGVLSARLILGSMLSESALNRLLGTQLFVDVGHHQVKMYPDELVPFLAARRLSELVKSPEYAVTLVGAISWEAPTGEKGVYRNFLPLAGWLGTLNAHCRRVLLERDPQVVAFFGDLRNRGVGRTDAEDALRQSLRRFAAEGDSPGRGHFTLTSENYWQATISGIDTLLVELFDEYRDMPRVTDILLEIASSAQSDVLRTRVIEGYGGDFSKLVQTTNAVRYLLEVGGTIDRDALASALLAGTPVREELSGFLLASLAWNPISATQIADLVAERFGRGGGGFHIGWYLNHQVVDTSTPDQLFALAHALVRRLLASQRGAESGSRDYRTETRFLDLVSELVAKLVEQASGSLVERVARLCWALQELATKAHLGPADFRDLHRALVRNVLLRRSLLRLIIRRADRSGADLDDKLHGYGTFCPILEGDVEAIGDPSFTAVEARHEALRAAAAEREESKPEPQPRQFTIDEKSQAALAGMEAALRDGTATHALAWIAGWLLQTNPQSRYGEVDFSVFEREVGPAVASAVRAGLSARWRTHPPLFNETEPNSTFNLTAAGLQGLFLELGDGNALPRLSDKEVRQALSYAPFEINGYPKWFWSLVRAHEAASLGILASLIQAAGAGPVSLSHAEEFLSSLSEAPAAVQAALAGPAWAFVVQQLSVRTHVVGRILQVVMSKEGAVPHEAFVEEAQSRVERAFSVEMPTEDALVEAWRQRRAVAVVWGTIWLQKLPENFRGYLDRWYQLSEGAANQFIFEMAAKLGQDGRGRLSQITRSGQQGIQTLMYMYNHVSRVVKPEDDADRSDGEVYAVSARDNAESFRDDIVPAIADAASQDGYDALEVLRRSAAGERALYLRRLQIRMQEDRLTRPALQQQCYDAFEADFTVSLTDAISFAMAVHADLLKVKYEVERGEFSLRRFFSVLEYPRETVAKSGLALEDDFQAWLGSELNHACAGKYGVTLESQLPEATRRDLLCRKDTFYASIELKMSERWTIPEYLEALELQLVGQYMRARNSQAGFFVVVLQRKKTWVVPGTRGKVDFDGLISILNEKARQLEVSDRNRFLRVIGIDATPPGSFRAKRAVTPTGAKKAKRNPKREKEASR